MIKIREADKESDLPAILECAVMFAKEAGMGPYLPPTMEEFYQHVARVIFDPAVTVLLATEGDRVVGGLGYATTPYIWNPSLVCSEELFYWCHPDADAMAGYRLIREAGRRMDAADMTVFHRLPSSPAKLDEVYRMMGYAPLQSSFVKRN